MPKPLYLTTAIDYTNGAPHIGHAYEKVLADVSARFHRLTGESAFFLTGVDQHGQKVQQSAEKTGLSPQQFVDEITAKFIALWEKLEVRYDIWAATTDPLHKRCVQGMLQRLYGEGQIYKDKQEGYYSIRQEQFLTDKERGPDGEFGPEWGLVEHRVEENYYFRLAQHKEWLLGYLRTHPDCVTPDFRQTELINAVEKLSGDLCISRPKSRLSWGIELPFDSDYVNFVWFDALTNYISFVGYDPTISSFFLQPSSFQEKWPALHIIGKDILIPAHGIYWPIMLHALGFPDEQMPRFIVHGWWNMSGAKMSKSLGNVVDPLALVEKYSPGALRYYLMADITSGKDADFSEERLVSRYNSELANSLGNLLNRTLNMTWKFADGKLTRSGAESIDIREEYAAAMAAHFIHQGLNQALQLATFCNERIDSQKPWALAKDPAQRAALDALLYWLAESLRIIAILISPVLPGAAHGIFDQLNWQPDLSGKEERFSLADAEWGRLPDRHVVGKPVPLFPRIEIEPEPTV
ncbi:MAG TPA: class I tRNA ligase family protein [Chthoniobacterales bacterium]|jgi:methionyl-tRNA synthetase|nr:class I tRNA ligase family protein [Chthoniobacterales bacterium]